MRQIRAYLKNGAELGFLVAKGRWSTTKHSRRTRKAINSLMSKRILVISEFDDPVRVYLSYRSEEHTSELQSLMRISYAVFCLKKKNNTKHQIIQSIQQT